MFGNYTAKDYENFNIEITKVELAFLKRCPKNYSYANKNREFYGLVFILRGKLFIEFNDGRRFSAQKGDVLYLKKGANYRINSASDERLEYAVISFDFKESPFVKMLPFDEVNTTLKTQRFEELFEYICDIWYVKSIGYLLHTKAMLELVIYELMHDRFAKNFGRNAPDKIQATAEYMERCFDREISIETLAKMCGYSEPHYRKMFKKIYGMTPTEYISVIRIEKAKDLLKTGLYSLDEISNRCGFNSTNYFTRVFKKYTGTTPGKY